MSDQDCIRLSIARDFSEIPGPRWRIEGPKSGEEFYETVLLPRFQRALESQKKLFVDLDDTAGYATSFLEESFGNLSIRYGAQTVLNSLILKSDDEAFLTEEIERYIKEAKPK